MEPLRTDCLVVGAGPVGMVTALELARHGRTVTIIDKYRRTALYSYALALHPQTLRLLDEMGICERLVELGQPVRWIEIHDGPTRVGEIDVSRVGGPFPFVLVVPQTALEGALETALGDEDVFVHWEHQLLGFESNVDAVDSVLAAVDLETGAAGPRVVHGRVRSAYLVGADGAGSSTARALGVAHTEVGPPIDVSLVEFEGEIRSPDRLHLVLGPGTADVLWPLGPERARWSVQHDGGPDPVDPRELVRARAPWFGPLERVEWNTTARFQPCLADRFGRKRAWLAGDAGHVTSPIGVQSMNVGMREGRDLARRIAEVLEGRNSPRLLRIYNEERQREWKMLLGMKNRVRPNPDAPQWIRERTAQLVASLPASGRDLNALLTQVGLRLDWLRRRPGSGAIDG
jgi:2-polyprenyl-6-methoxyphenol hydroxylase-like FAD-dependent oxidoreductase